MFVYTCKLTALDSDTLAVIEIVVCYVIFSTTVLYWVKFYAIFLFTRHFQILISWWKRWRNYPHTRRLCRDILAKDWLIVFSKHRRGSWRGERVLFCSDRKLDDKRMSFWGRQAMGIVKRFAWDFLSMCICTKLLKRMSTDPKCLLNFVLTFFVISFTFHW